jgi:hypothetical protein
MTDGTDASRLLCADMKSRYSIKKSPVPVPRVHLLHDLTRPCVSGGNVRSFGSKSLVPRSTLFICFRLGQYSPSWYLLGNFADPNESSANVLLHLDAIVALTLGVLGTCFLGVLDLGVEKSSAWCCAHLDAIAALGQYYALISALVWVPTKCLELCAFFGLLFECRQDLYAAFSRYIIDPSKQFWMIAAFVINQTTLISESINTI